MEPKFENSLQENKKIVPLVKRLIECSTGEKLKVLRVNAGYHAKRRLANLGIIPGVQIIKRKAAPFRGPIEVIVKGSLLVIGRGLAARIIVMIEKSK
ncbi:MAG: ferrous iron transport protein A [Candidatus Lokiarchaeota archaeon]|nr:ferrous iron transport protein A [Candidatus Lokiarchaeota archaeon]